MRNGFPSNGPVVVDRGADVADIAQASHRQPAQREGAKGDDERAQTGEECQLRCDQPLLAGAHRRAEVAECQWRGE